MRLGPVWGSSGRRRGGAWNPAVPRRWGRPPLPGQDPSNQPKTPPVPSPPLAPCGAWLLLPRAAGPDGQRCPGAGEMPACRGAPRAALSSSSSLPGQHPPPPAHPCPPGRAARGTCGAAHVQAVICSPGKAPRREGTGGTGITRLLRGRAAAPASPAGDSPPPVSFALSAAGSRWIKYLEVCSGE